MTETTFQTTDSLLAAFLLSKNRTIVAIRRLEGVKQKERAVFVFDDPDQKVNGPSGLKREFFADGLAPARTMGWHWDNLRRCVRDHASGTMLGPEVLAELFPTDRRRPRKRKGLRGLRLLDLRVLLFLCEPLFGDDRDARLAWASRTLSREISSFKDLLASEAARLITLLLKAARTARKQQIAGSPVTDSIG